MFHIEELQEINEKVEKMGNKIIVAIEHTLEAFETKNESLVGEVILKNREITELEQSIEKNCLTLKEKQLREESFTTILVVMKVVTDLVHISEYLSDIADLFPADIESIDNYSKHIKEIGSTSKEMMEESMQSISTNRRRSQKLKEKKDVIENLFLQVKEEIISQVSSSSESASLWIDILMITKCFDRIGKHAVNINKWMGYFD